MDLHGFPDDFSNRHTGIEGSEGVLKDHLHIPAQASQGVPFLKAQVRTLKKNLTAGWPVELKHAPGRGGLAASALPHQTQGLACFQINAAPIDAFDEKGFALPEGAKFYGKMDLHVGDLK